MGKGKAQFLIKFISVLFSVLGMGFCFWYFKPDDTISMAAFLGFVAPLLILCLLLVEWILLNALSAKKEVVLLPKLKLISNGKYIFEPSEIFSHDSFVTLIHVGDTEQLVGWGRIEAVISSTKNLQVEVVGFAGNFDEQKLKIDSRNVVLKPAMPFAAMTQILKTLYGHKPKSGDTDHE